MPHWDKKWRKGAELFEEKPPTNVLSETENLKEKVEMRWPVYGKKKFLSWEWLQMDIGFSKVPTLAKRWPHSAGIYL